MSVDPPQQREDASIHLKTCFFQCTVASQNLLLLKLNAELVLQHFRTAERERCIGIHMNMLCYISVCTVRFKKLIFRLVGLGWLSDFSLFFFNSAITVCIHSIFLPLSGLLSFKRATN